MLARLYVRRVLRHRIGVSVLRYTECRYHSRLFPTPLRGCAPLCECARATEKLEDGKKGWPYAASSSNFEISINAGTLNAVHFLMNVTRYSCLIVAVGGCSSNTTEWW